MFRPVRKFACVCRLLLIDRLDGVDLVRWGNPPVLGIHQAAMYADEIAVFEFRQARVLHQGHAATVGVDFVHRSITEPPTFGDARMLELAGQRAIILGVVETRVRGNVNKRLAHRSRFADRA